jgi:hypothetical protein
MRNPIETWRRQPRIVRFLLCHVAVGFGVAAVFVGGFVAADPNGAGTVLLTAADHWWPVVALWGLMGLTFGAAQIGAAMMLLANGDGPAPRRGTLMPAPALLRARSVRQR